MVENVALVIILHGTGFRMVPLVAGLLATGALFVLAGFVAIARYDSINEFLLPSAVYSGVLSLPLIAYLAGWDHWLLYLHPVQAPLVLLSAAFQPIATWQVAYGVAYSALWIGLGWIAGQAAFRRFVVGRVGTR